MSRPRGAADRAAAVLSQRGQRLLSRPPVPEYLQEHFARSAADDPAISRDRYIPLCVAENLEMSNALLARLAAVEGVPPRVLAYDAMVGAVSFRRQLGEFLGRTVFGRTFAPEQIAVLAGAGSVLELLFHNLADAGDGVLVPTPSYAGFWLDLELRDELSIVPVPCRREDDFRLTTELLERSRSAAERPIRALLFTSPNNPLGTVYSAAEVDEILDWAGDAGIHVVFDEVYALSVHGQRPFISAAQRRLQLGDRVHLVWAFSKDFGASGLRCGVLVSENAALLAAVDALAYWECCSGHTQYLLGEIVSDTEWVDGYLATMRSGLAQRYRVVTRALDEHGVPYLTADAGFFVLLDLRAFLAQASWEAEHALWRQLLESANLNLTPGAACRIDEPGFLRLCFGSVDAETAERGIRRLASVIGASGNRKRRLVEDGGGTR